MSQLAIATICLLLSVRAHADARDVAKAQRLYALNDQHDTIALALHDALTERAVNAVEAAARKIQWDQAQGAYTRGALSEKTMRDLEMQLTLDELAGEELGARVDGFRAKLTSLEALRDGNLVGFARGDRDTNVAQLAAAAVAVKKADVIAARAREVYERLRDAQSAVAWATFHSAHTAMDTAAELAAGARRRHAEQAKQLTAAQAELDELEKPHDPKRPSPPRG